MPAAAIEVKTVFPRLMTARQPPHGNQNGFSEIDTGMPVQLLSLTSR
jgi:hypothetical protein